MSLDQSNIHESKSLVDLETTARLSIFNGKKVIITGHTGFKGSWLTIWLRNLGAEVIGISLEPLTHPSLFDSVNLKEEIRDLRIDVRNSDSVRNIFMSEQPDFVFHLAAQSLVHKSYMEPTTTWETNVLGTINVLEGLKLVTKKCAAVFITSDKCYKNVEWLWGYRENDALGGDDPYSASKAAAELAIHSYVKSYFSNNNNLIRLATARAGNVIGGGDWSEHRIVPDCVKSWSKNESVSLRNPNSTRPWQHVLEPLSGYLTLAEQLFLHDGLHGESFNFGPSSQVEKSVVDLVNEMAKYWKNVKWTVEPISQEKVSEASLLRLNCDKAGSLLNWVPTLNFEETVEMTAEWYRKFHGSSTSMLDLCTLQIENYASLARARTINWALS
jgi:CDP-glucose 4,6-dehydratase